MKVYTYKKIYFQYKKFYSNYLKQITSILNNYHQKNLSKDYWEPIVGMYLRKFILNYLFLKNDRKKNSFIKANYKNINFYKNYIEFASEQDQFLYKFENTNKNQYYKIKKINFLSDKLNTIITILPNILTGLKVTKIFFQESYFKNSFKTLFTLKSFFYLSSLPSLKVENYNIDKEKIFLNRLNLIKIHEIKNKKDFLLQNIVFNMPINYFENYDSIFKEVKKIKLSEAIYVDGNEVKFDFIKFYIAELILKKKKIFTGQHSLRTGLEDSDIYFDYSKSISNYYLSWGWTNKISSVIKFSSTRILSSLNKYKKVLNIKNNINNICFILCGFSKLGICLHDNYSENIKAEKSRIDLLNQIKKQKRFVITLKPRGGSFLIQNKKNFYNKFNMLNNKTRMYDIFGNYNVVIFERLSLGVAECIYLNQPTIFYYPQSLYKQKNKQFKELLFFLKKANIYFDDKKKVMKLLRSTENISLWWGNKKNVKNRKKFLKKYANCFSYDDLNKFKKLV